MNHPENNTAYEKAKKRLEEEKGFYRHLTVYIIVNLVIIIGSNNLINVFNNEHVTIDSLTGLMGWHTLSTPFFWGIGLVIHGLRVFRQRIFSAKTFTNTILGNEWEERKIRELMNDENF